MGTPILSASEWNSAGSQPWLQSNGAFRLLDGMAWQTSVLDRDLTAPPGTCDDGARYLVASGATGAWDGRDGFVAVANGVNAANGWLFVPADRNGLHLWIEDEAVWFQYQDGSWEADPERITLLSQLEDVSLVSIADGNVLKYDLSNTTFFNAADESAETVPAVAINGVRDFNPPSLALFSTTFLGSAVALGTAYDENKGLSVWRTDSGGTGNYRGGFIGKAIPAGASWTAELGIRDLNIRQAAYSRFGFCLLESGTGKWVASTVSNGGSAAGDFSYNTAYRTGIDGTPSFDGSSFSSPSLTEGIMWKIEYDGTNYVFSVSFDDGNSYFSLSSQAKATRFTSAPDLIGLFIGTYNTSYVTSRCMINYYSDPDFPA